MLSDIDLMIRGAVIGISVLTFAILASNARASPSISTKGGNVPAPSQPEIGR